MKKLHLFSLLILLFPMAMMSQFSFVEYSKDFASIREVEKNVKTDRVISIEEKQFDNKGRLSLWKTEKGNQIYQIVYSYPDEKTVEEVHVSKADGGDEEKIKTMVKKVIREDEKERLFGITEIIDDAYLRYSSFLQMVDATPMGKVTGKGVAEMNVLPLMKIEGETPHNAIVLESKTDGLEQEPKDRFIYFLYSAKDNSYYLKTIESRGVLEGGKSGISEYYFDYRGSKKLYLQNTQETNQTGDVEQIISFAYPILGPERYQFVNTDEKGNWLEKETWQGNKLVNKIERVIVYR